MKLRKHLRGINLHLRLLRLNYGARRLVHDAFVRYEAFRRKTRSTAEARSRLQFIQGELFSNETLQRMSTEELQELLDPLMYLEASLEAQAELVEKVFQLLFRRISTDQRSEEAIKMMDWRTTLLAQRDTILSRTAVIHALIESRPRTKSHPRESRVC